MSAKRIVVGISGASGSVYGLGALELLGRLGVETHLVVTEAGARVLEIETGETVETAASRAGRLWNNEDIAAPLASGSFRTAGMIVAPCSIRTLSAVACCRSSNLLERAADVSLKERRPLVLLVRETPLHEGHLRLMLEAARAGAIVMPPVPAFHFGPRTIDDLVHHTLCRALDALGLDHDLCARWGEPPPPPGRGQV